MRYDAILNGDELTIYNMGAGALQISFVYPSWLPPPCGTWQSPHLHKQMGRPCNGPLLFYNKRPWALLFTVAFTLTGTLSA